MVMKQANKNIPHSGYQKVNPQKVNIVWLKRDLRLDDHKPFFTASGEPYPVIPLYIFEKQLYQQPDMAFRHWKFVQDCLSDLNQQLEKLGSQLCFQKGEAVEVFKNLFLRYAVQNVYAHEETGNMWTYKRDLAVHELCKTHHVCFQEFPNNSVVRRLASRDLWHRIHKERLSESIRPRPLALRSPPDMHCESWMEISRVNFHADHHHYLQSGGRSVGEGILKTFLSKRAEKYIKTLANPYDSPDFSSRLSPYIAYGVFSTKEIHGAIDTRLAALKDDLHPQNHAAKPQNKDYQTWHLKKGLRAMQQRLHWHCHFIQKLEDEPEIEFKCQHSLFENCRPRPGNPKHIEAWFYGQTGIPIIDAVMRCLHQTGWINFRMRAMVASFASYHLWLDWRETAPLLARLFTDYEPGIHYAQYQMQSGTTGINTFRIYNPYKQSLDHDPKGGFIKKYCPELRHLEPESLHDPRFLHREALSGLLLTEDSIPELYRTPIIDHKAALTKARQSLSKVLGQEGYKEESKRVYEKHGSRRKAILKNSSQKSRNGKAQKKTPMKNDEKASSKQTQSNQLDFGF